MMRCIFAASNFPILSAGSQFYDFAALSCKTEPIDRSSHFVNEKEGFD